MTTRTIGRLALGMIAALMLTSGIATAQDNEFAEPLTALAQGEIKQIAANPVLVAAIIAQNAATGGYDQAKIDELDTQWRAEVDAASKPLIDATLANEASAYLAKVQEDSAGKFTEIFATDAKGLNAAQSTVTSDYWQGDEDKFTESFGSGADAVFLGEVEQDESTQTFQSQVSVTVVDPATGSPIGSITFGVDLSTL
jgi:outer membrane murein-binding lipoprotein Lpp